MAGIYIPPQVKSGGFIPTSEEMSRISSALSRAPKRPPFDRPSPPPPGRYSTQPTLLTAVNDHLIPSTADLTDAEHEMVTTSVLWIQHVTIGYCKQTLGWSDAKVSDPNVRNSPEFWNAVTQVITNYTGWAAMASSYDTRYRDQTHSGSINISAIVQTILSALAGADAAAQIGQLAANLATTQSVGVQNVATFFWNRKYQSQSASQFTMSPIVKNSNGDPEYTYLFTYESVTQESWRTLFVQSHYESFDFSAVSITLRFYLDQWSLVRDQVRAKLAQWLTSDVNGAPLG